MNKKILFGVVMIVLFCGFISLPYIALAQASDPGSCPTGMHFDGQTCTEDAPVDNGGGGGGGAPGSIILGMLNSIKGIFFVIAVGIVTILWVITGLLFVMARGAPEKINNARKALFTAIAGTLFIIIANIAISLVGQAFGL